MKVIFFIDTEKIVGWLKIGSLTVNSLSQPEAVPKLGSTHIWTISEIVQKYELYFSLEVKKWLLDFSEWISEIFDAKIPQRLFINYFWKNYSRPVLFSLSPYKKKINVYWMFIEILKNWPKSPKIWQICCKDGVWK